MASHDTDVADGGKPNLVGKECHDAPLEVAVSHGHIKNVSAGGRDIERRRILRIIERTSDIAVDENRLETPAEDGLSRTELDRGRDLMADDVETVGGDPIGLDGAEDELAHIAVDNAGIDLNALVCGEGLELGERGFGERVERTAGDENGRGRG